MEGVEIVLDDVRFGLREPCDFAWLREYGRVFAAFDRQDSGNICFGVENEAGRRFIKFAGARPLEYDGEPAEAVARLAAAMPTYEALRHPALTPLVEHGPVAGGYVAVYEWFPGESLHAHWRFAGADKFGHPDSPNYRFVRLPLEKRLAAYGAILGFHRHVEACGYLAIDFYDGSILYDFATDRVRVCDIDFYTPVPYVNTMGRMWGSSRFMSPEEFRRGAAIDARTNVFTMGATAFALLGDGRDGGRDRGRAGWAAGEALYRVAARAVAEDPATRHDSVAALCDTWARALAASS